MPLSLSPNRWIKLPANDAQSASRTFFTEAPLKCFRILAFNAWRNFATNVLTDSSNLSILASKVSILSSAIASNTSSSIILNGTNVGSLSNPEGAKKDGSSIHFFHKTINAYTTGQRKRRKIHHLGSTEEHVRWHKTGKTKAVIEDGVHKGFKKIMVLYIRSEKGSKSYKSNWRMHQYHLGTNEAEKNGEYVVSKVLYKEIEKNEENPMAEEPDNITLRTSPRTPKPNPPNPPRAGICVENDDNIDETALLSFAEDAMFIPIPGESHAPLSDIQDQDNTGNPALLAGESQALDTSGYDGLDDILLCKEIFDPSDQLNDPGLDSIGDDFAYNENRMPENDNITSGTTVLDTLELDTPDFDLWNLNFGSQDSIFDWLDKL